MKNINDITQCPYCKKPTIRTSGEVISTCVYYPPIYDENGVNTNPDRNTSRTVWHCYECKQDYYVTN